MIQISAFKFLKSYFLFSNKNVIRDTGIAPIL